MKDDIINFSVEYSYEPRSQQMNIHLLTSMFTFYVIVTDII